MKRIHRTLLLALFGATCLFKSAGEKVTRTGQVLIDTLLNSNRNIVHGSDSVESAKKEIALWFKPEEVCDWTLCAEDWVYEEN